jgi:hypothetical protein
MELLCPLSIRTRRKSERTSRIEVCRERMGLPKFTDEIQYEADQNTDDDACGKRKIERKIFPLDEDVSRELSQERQFLDAQNHEANHDQDGPE